MISDRFRHNDLELDTLARNSLSEFMVSQGGRLLKPSELVPERHLGVHFDSSALISPLRVAYEGFALPIRVAQTLLLSEPGETEVRLVFPPTDWGRVLGALNEGEPRRFSFPPNADWLAVTSPDLPHELLKEFLARWSKQLTEEGVPVGVPFHSAFNRAVGDLTGAVVARYYQQIDRGNDHDLDEICELFSDSAEYRRGGEALLGKKRISDFYRSERSLVGSHELHTITTRGLDVEVKGTFHGVSQQSKEARELSFIDVWSFNLEGTVTQRETYLQMGFSETV